MVVTAVDNSPEMLALLPDAACAVHANIEDLELATKFDVVLLASHLINHPDEQVRRAFVRCAHRHAHGSTHVLIQCHDADWLKSVTAGFESAAGELRVQVERVRRRPTQVSMTLAYCLAGEVWRQTFAAVPLNDEEIESLLADEGWEVTDRIGPKATWTVARCRS